MVVTGFTDGTAANSTRPAAVAAPSVAVRATIFGPPGPRSHAAQPTSSRARAESSTMDAALMQ